jgi:uncharacterized coiled-coil protein SlyX
LHLSVFELYNEELVDLLTEVSPAPRATTDATILRIREDRGPSGRGIFVEGLTAVPIKTAAEATGLIGAALKCQRIRATFMSRLTSRSHTVIQLVLRQMDHTAVDDAGRGATTVSQLCLCDLAGSERLRDSGPSVTTGERLKESLRINKSISTLGLVIHRLTDVRGIHVPYRDSKLTRLLQDALGGNAKTTLICTCLPSRKDASETLATLQFGAKARFVRNRPRRNRELSGDQLQAAYAAAVEEIEALKGQVSLLLAAAPPSCPETVNPVTSDAPDDAIVPVASDADEMVVAALRNTVRSLTLQRAQVEANTQRDDAAREELQRRVAFYQERATAAEAAVAASKQAADESESAFRALTARFEALARIKGQFTAPVAVAPAPAPPQANRAAAGKSSSARTASVAGRATSRRGSSNPSTGVGRAGAPASTKGAPIDSGSSSAPPSVRTADITAPALPPSDAEGKTQYGSCEIAAALEAASAAEAAAKLEEVAVRALVRERALLSQVSALREEVVAAQRYPIVISRLTGDLELAQTDCVRLVERKASECEAVLKRQEAELVALQAQLDARNTEVEQLQAQLAPVEESLARYRAAAVEAALPAPATAPESDSDPDRASPPGSARNRRSGDTAHLEAVVEALHSENRANAVRLVEFARTVERQAARIRELEARGDALERRVDESPFLTDGVKEQLLTGTRLQGQRSHFRQRMMERFGALVGEANSDDDGGA